MKKKLKPWVARFISSEFLLNVKRRFHETKRAVLKQPHLVSVFIRVDDPYSYLLLQVMPDLERRYRVEFGYHIVSHLQDHMYPELTLWHQNALRDSAHIAKLYKLALPSIEEIPTLELTEAVSKQLLALEQGVGFVERALIVLTKYWQGGLADIETDHDLNIERSKVKLSENEALLDSLGHYLSATLHYGGEWYWGIDRLAHLEHRLNYLRLNQLTPEIKYQENTKYFCRRLADIESLPKRPNTPLTIYFSARSPYSYLGLERGVALAKHYGVPIEVKPVLPMMMRGVLVPPRKKWYIFKDTKREALKLGLDYGYVADPLGAGVERCYALFEYAQAQNKEVEYLLAFARAVNTRAVHSDTDQGMKIIVEDAGLDWSAAKPLFEKALVKGDWRNWAQHNYSEMHSYGLWGVPCFQYADVSVWGQDRIDVLEQAICDSIKFANAKAADF